MTTWRHHWRSMLSAVCALALCLIVAVNTGAVAGAMTTLRAHLPLGRLLSTREPTASSSPIKHIVFMIEENRSFDNVFGRFPGADGAMTATVSIGGGTTTTSLVPEPYYLWHDIGHDWHDAQLSIDGGKMDGFSHIS